ncbi:TPA: hypothetical protein ACH3X3_003860 [Trebouxia sp. C0006]
MEPSPRIPLLFLLSRRLRYRTSQEENDAMVVDPRAGPREKVAARLLRIEKSILSGKR